MAFPLLVLYLLLADQEYCLSSMKDTSDQSPATEQHRLPEKESQPDKATKSIDNMSLAYKHTKVPDERHRQAVHFKPLLPCNSSSRSSTSSKKPVPISSRQPGKSGGSYPSTPNEGTSSRSNTTSRSQVPKPTSTPNRQSSRASDIWSTAATVGSSARTKTVKDSNTARPGTTATTRSPTSQVRKPSRSSTAVQRPANKRIPSSTSGNHGSSSTSRHSSNDKRRVELSRTMVVEEKAPKGSTGKRTILQNKLIIG
ncbi:hypothetical protein F4780DRAFT_57497 [Xylariomycetidae sp. FL0641]|nr:hypothetical protein F4780DRAFT_57497 [Xylariomycetidae sp. FL0641]